jgi:AraC-like DNA-binding protein/quercetin dioxygenase-like cupin family protein
MRRRRLTFEPIHANDGSSFFCRSVQGAHFGFGWHQHPELEIALVLKGHGRRYVGDSIEDFVDGDLVLLGADVPHTWQTDPADGPVASKVIQFRPEVFGNLLHEAPELRSIAHLLKRADRGLRLYGSTRQEVERIFLRILEATAPSWRSVCDLVSLLGIISDSSEVAELSSAAPLAHPVEGTGRKMDQVLAYLHGPPDEIPSQAQAARQLQLSPAAFSRFFRQSVGRTYVACVNEVRVLATCRELIETDRPIIDIAYGAGFTNLSNFNRRFRALKGMPPRQFRSQARQAEARSPTVTAAN